MTDKVKKKAGVSPYIDLVREHATASPDVSQYSQSEMATYLNGEQVDTVHSFCNRNGYTAGVARQIYLEFDRLGSVLPNPYEFGNRKFWATSFLEPVISAIASELYSKTEGKQKLNHILEKLKSKPELVDAIAELLEEVSAR